MTRNRKYHADHVEDWIQKAAKGLSPEKTVQLFEHALNALWQRARKNLSEVTLMAVVERVIFNCSEAFTFLSLVKVEASGVRMDELQKKAPSLEENAMMKATQIVLTDFLTVTGSLTGEVL